MKKRVLTFGKATLITAVVIGVLLGNFQIVNASGKEEEIAETEEAIEITDENGEVMAIFIPYSENNPAPSEFTRATEVSVNTSLEGYKRGFLSNIYSFNDGQRIQLNITISPQVSSNIGLYNRNTDSFGFPAGGLSSSGWYGTLEVVGSGRYSLAFQNNSGTTTTYKGSYSF